MNTSNEFEQAAARRRVRAGQCQHIDSSYLADSHARVVHGDIESRPMPIEYADGEPLTMGETLSLLAIGILCVGVVVGLVLAIATR